MIEVFMGSFLGSFLVMSIFYYILKIRMNFLHKECALAKLQIKQIVAHINTAKKFSTDAPWVPNLELEVFNDE